MCGVLVFHVSQNSPLCPWPGLGWNRGASGWKKGSGLRKSQKPAFGSVWATYCMVYKTVCTKEELDDVEEDFRAVFSCFCHQPIPIYSNLRSGVFRHDSFSAISPEEVHAKAYPRRCCWHLGVAKAAGQMVRGPLRLHVHPCEHNKS